MSSEKPRPIVALDTVEGAPAVEDLRDLEPPEPMQRVLAAASALAPGGVYLALLPRFPRLLVPRLEERALAFTITPQADGTALLRVERPA